MTAIKNSIMRWIKIRDICEVAIKFEPIDDDYLPLSTTSFQHQLNAVGNSSKLRQ